MLAAIVEQKGVIKVRKLPEPKIGDYEALCELLYGAICTGTDTHIINCVFPWGNPLPTILGHESVGRVVAVGRKVRNFKVGDMITRVGAPSCPREKVTSTWGGFAELGVAKDHWAMCADRLPAAEWMGARVNQVVPAGVDPRVAPMFTTWRETLSCLLRLGVAQDSSVLVAGSGGNGLAFAAHAVNIGAKCVALVGAERMSKKARELAHVRHYFDYKLGDLDQAINAACPAGFDFMIDAVGKAGMADRILPCLKAGGKYTTYGLDDLGKITFNPARSRGTFTVQGVSYDEAETHQRVAEFVLQGKLDALLWYDPDNPYPLAEIGRAFEDLRRRKSPKALIRLH